MTVKEHRKIWIDGSTYVMIATIAGITSAVSGLSKQPLSAITWDQWTLFACGIAGAGLNAFKAFRNTAMLPPSQSNQKPPQVNL